jgi:hypothetical protein
MDVAAVVRNQQPSYNVGTLAILVGNGDGTFAPATARTTTEPLDVVPADFNADGRTDLAVLSTALSPLAILLRIGSTATIAPPALAFPATPARSTSPTRTVNVSNTGTDDLHIALAGLTGANSADFSKVADHCSGATIAPGTSCAIDLAFNPRTVGNRAASLRIVDDAGAGLQSTSLQGAGLIKYPRSELGAPAPPAAASAVRGQPPPPAPPSGVGPRPLIPHPALPPAGKEIGMTQPVRLFRLLLL